MTTSDWDIVASGDLTAGEIDTLKRTYGPLFKKIINGRPHYFRTITRHEANDLGLKDGYLDADQEESIVRIALVHPDVISFDDISAGLPTKISQEILERSGFAGDEWLNEYLGRAKANQSVYHTIAATICAAFPALLPGELDSLNVYSLIELLVTAEEVLAIKAKVQWGQYAPLSFVSGVDDLFNTELTNEERDAAVRMMLEQGMGEVPSGWVDKTKVPKGPGYIDASDLDPGGTI